MSLPWERRKGGAASPALPSRAPALLAGEPNGAEAQHLQEVERDEEKRGGLQLHLLKGSTEVFPAMRWASILQP